MALYADGAALKRRAACLQSNGATPDEAMQAARH